MRTRTHLLSLLAAGFVLLLSAPIHAQVVGSSFHTGNVLVEGPPEQLPVNGASLTTPFFLPAASRVTVIVSADCGVSGANPLVFLELDVLVDGFPVAPSHPNDFDALCSANHTSAINDAFIGGAITGRTLAVVAGGNHIVRVFARTSDNVTDGAVGDISVIVMR